MKHITFGAILCTFLLALSPVTWADRVEVKGVGTYTFDEKNFTSEKPNAAEKQLGIGEAKKSAWKGFVAKQNPSLQQLIVKNEQHFIENLDRYIIDAVVLDASKDQNTKTLTIVARIAFNDVAVSQYVQQASIGSGTEASRSTDSTFAFLFMARKQIFVKQFDERRTDVQKSTVASTKAADRAVTNEAIIQSGGNILRKEDEISYAMTSSQDIDTAMNEALSTSGIEPVAYDDIVTTCNGLPAKSFQNEYVSADEMSPKTRASVFAAARNCEIRYFATGTVDSGAPTRDPVSGSVQVFVSVRAQLMDLSQKLPRKVGSVGPKTFSGLGPDQSVATRNALVAATKETAKIFADQLNAKGIR